MAQMIEPISFKEIPYFETIEMLNSNVMTSCQTYSFPVLNAQLDSSSLIAVKAQQSYASFNIAKDNIMIIDTKCTPNNDSIVITKIDGNYTITTYSSAENNPFLGTMIQVIRDLD